MIAAMISMYLDLMKFGLILTYDITMYLLSIPLSVVQLFIPSFMPSVVPKTISDLNNINALNEQVDYYQQRMKYLIDNLESVAKNTATNLENTSAKDICDQVTQYQGMLKNLVNNLEALTKNTTANLEANSLTVNQLIVGKEGKSKDS